MQVLVDQKPRAELVNIGLSSLTVSTPTGPIVGKVLHQKAATVAFRRMALVIALIAFLALVPIIYFGTVNTKWMSGLKSDQFVIPVALLIALAAIFKIWFYRRLFSVTKRANERAKALPPRGTAISVDSRGITVGTRIYDWPNLRIDALELVTNDRVTLSVERAILAGKEGPVALDRDLIENGQAMVDAACQRLLPAGG